MGGGPKKKCEGSRGFQHDKLEGFIPRGTRV